MSVGAKRRRSCRLDLPSSPTALWKSCTRRWTRFRPMSPGNYLRQSLQLLLPLLEQIHQRSQALEARLVAVESRRE
jgi:hypothetical protein